MRHTRARRPKLKTLSIKVPEELSARVLRLAKERHTTVSEVVRDALSRYDAPMRGSFGELAKEHIGSVEGGPGDLATNPRHLEDFGKWRR
jgi:hypothetical protein